MLDYFVHDPRNSASPIDLAVSLLRGGKEPQLPDEMTSGLLHLEMLSEAEREMFSGKKKETVSDQPGPERGPQEEEASKMSAIGIRFDIDKLTDRSNSYGLEAWKVFWRAVQPSDVNGVSFRAGDEFGCSVYTIAVSVHEKNGAMVQKICSSLAASSDFDKLCAYPQFLEGEARCRRTTARRPREDGGHGGRLHRRPVGRTLGIGNGEERTSGHELIVLTARRPRTEAVGIAGITATGYPGYQTPADSPRPPVDQDTRISLTG